MQHYMLWSCDHEDRNGMWSWGVKRDWGDDLSANYIHPYLKNYESKTWGEIESEETGEKDRRRRNFSYRLDQIKDEAHARLLELELDDQPSIFRFRMTGPHRLYGFIFGHTFGTVWFDPTHDIYKSSS